MQRLLDGGCGRDKAKCKLWYLTAGLLPLEVRGEDVETIQMSFFPCLDAFSCGVQCLVFVVYLSFPKILSPYDPATGRYLARAHCM